MTVIMHVEVHISLNFGLLIILTFVIYFWSGCDEVRSHTLLWSCLEPEYNEVFNSQ